MSDHRARLDENAVELRLKAAFEHEGRDVAIRLLLEAYGAEILGYLEAVCRDPSLADEAYSMFCEGAWQSLPRFRGESRIRTWAYSIARNSLLRLLRDQRRRGRSFVHVDTDAWARQPAPPLSTLTGTETHALRARAARLRAELNEADLTLLVLRVDREMSWEEIVVVLEGESDDPGRSAAKLRKQFQRLRERLAKALRDS